VPAELDAALSLESVMHHPARIDRALRKLNHDRDRMVRATVRFRLAHRVVELL